MKKSRRKIDLKKVKAEYVKQHTIYHMNDKSRDNFYKVLGKRLKFGRVARGMTQTKVARQIGVTFQQVQKYEKGSNGTNLFNLKQIADALQVSVLYFCAEEKPLLLTKEMELTNDQSASR